MPLSLTHKACGKCGALVAVTSSEGGGVDNEQAHLEWHRLQEELLTALSRHTASSIRSRLAGWIQRHTSPEDAAGGHETREKSDA